MKTDWEMKTIGDVSSVINGGTPKSRIPEYWGGNVQWLTPKDMGKMIGREIGATSRTITERGIDNSSAKLVPENSVILSTRAPIGHLAVNTQPMAFNQGCRGLIPRKELNYLFLYYFLKSQKSVLESLGTGATFKELSSGNLKSVPIPLPHLNEQQRIVHILESAFEWLARAQKNAETNKENLQELRRTILDNVFSGNLGDIEQDGWEVKALGGFSEIKYGYTAKANYKRVGPRFLRITDIQNGQVNWDDVPYCQISKTDHMKHRLEKGDIVFARTGTTGKSYLIEDAPDAVCASYLIKVRPDKRIINAKYLSMYFHTTEYWKKISFGIKGAILGGFNASKLRALKIPLAPFEEQERIAAILNEVFSDTLRLEQNIDSHINDLSDLRRSLLQKAFAGELTN